MQVIPVQPDIWDEIESGTFFQGDQKWIIWTILFSELAFLDFFH